MYEGWEELDIFDSFLDGADPVVAVSPKVEKEQISTAISQDLQEIQAAEATALTSPSSSAVSHAVRMTVGAAARFVEAQVQALGDAPEDLDQLRDVQRKCTAAKDAVLLAVGNTFDQERMSQTRRQVFEAVTVGGQSPAQAAATVSAEAVRSVFAYPDMSEVVQVSIAAAAASVISIMSQAFSMGPLNKREISQSLKQALDGRPEGRLVMAFLSGLWQGRASTLPPAGTASALP
jgi:hypothetical protein